MIQLQRVSKQYDKGTIALRDINLFIDKGEFVYLIGPSGSGKSTLMKLLYREEMQTRGTIRVGDFNLNKLKERQVPHLRRTVGVVFQDFKLLPKLNVYENIAYALEVTGESGRTIKARVKEVLELVGLAHKAKSYPNQLSGGEQQRVAIGRAIITQPSLLLADEPTGALDSKSSAMILDQFETINRQGQTILMVTHSTTAASKAKRVLFIRDGILYHQLFRGDKTDTAFFQQISDTLTAMASRGE